MNIASKLVHAHLETIKCSDNCSNISKSRDTRVLHVHLFGVLVQVRGRINDICVTPLDQT